MKVTTNKQSATLLEVRATALLFFLSFLSKILPPPVCTREETTNQAKPSTQTSEGKNHMSKSAKQIAEILKNRAASKASAETTANESQPATENPSPIVNESTPAPAIRPLSGVALLRQQMAELQAKMDSLKEEETKESNARKVAFAEKLSSFLPSIGCIDLDDFASLFREYRKGLELGTNAGGARSKVDAAEKERILNIIRRAKAPDATPDERAKGLNLSVVAKATGVSYQNLRNWAKDAGLHTVTPRATTAV